MARAAAVVAERERGPELLLKVNVAARTVAPTVTLWPEEEDYACDCRGADPCEHVAAALIALRRALQQGQSLLQGRGVGAPGRVAYRLSREGHALALMRVRTGSEQDDAPFSGSLVELKERDEARGGRGLTVSRADLAVEVALGASRNGGVLSPAILAAVLEAMDESCDLKLDGQALTVGPPLPDGQLELDDLGEDFVLRTVSAPSEGERFSNGALLRATTVHPLVALPLSRDELVELTRGRRIPAARAGNLVAELLPQLQAKHEVKVRTTRLPRGQVQQPRLLVELRRQDDYLEALPTLVYGDPPTARLDGERLHLFDAQSVVPLRDELLERRLAQRLGEDSGLRLGRLERARGEDAVALRQRIERLRPRERSGEAALRAFQLAAPLQAQLEALGGSFQLRFGNGGAVVEGEVALAAWRAGLSSVLLPGDRGVAALPLDWLAVHGHRVEALLAARANDQGKTLAPLARIDLATLLEDLEQALPPELSQLKKALERFEGLPPREVPSDLRATLRAYQRRGMEWLCFLRELELGALLADDMGLGKTLQVIAALAPGARALVVAPASVLWSWKSELERFRPGLSVSVYHGAARRLDRGSDVTLTTYALLRIDQEQLNAQAWDVAVLDEAQQIKNPESQVAQAAFALEANWRIALSGTPVENRLEDLWSIFHFLNRGLLGGRSSFEQRYATPIASGSAEHAAQLRRRIRPLILRRRKEQVAPELPPRTELTLSCELDPAERAVYDAVRAATQQQVLAQLQQGSGVMAALEALLRLRQAACHSGLVPGQEREGSSKVSLLVEKLGEAASEGHRSLVFSQWTGLLDRVEPALEAAELAFCRLDGSTRDRQAVVETFQHVDGPPVMLISLKAGGVGLTLTAADHVFLLDPWWNPAVEQQAADRAHRIGQDKPVFVHRLVARDTVEERILALQEQKAMLAAAALDHGAVAGGLSRDDLIALLAD